MKKTGQNQMLLAHYLLDIPQMSLCRVPAEALASSLSGVTNFLFTRSSSTLHVTYTSDLNAARSWIGAHLENSSVHPALEKIPYGLDIEWRPNRRKEEDHPPALLQICANRGDILLLQLKGNPRGKSNLTSISNGRLGEVLSSSDQILSVLSSFKYLRIGNSIDNDMHQLLTHHGISIQVPPSQNDQIEPKATLELSSLAKFHHDVKIKEIYGNSIHERLTRHATWLSNPKTRLKLHHHFKIPHSNTFELINADISLLSTHDAIDKFLQTLDTIDAKEFNSQTREMQVPLVPDSSLSIVNLPIPSTFLKGGLKSLAERYLGVSIKSGHTALSNWESIPLSQEQIMYASIDAWVSNEVFYVILEDLRDIMNRSPLDMQLEMTEYLFSNFGIRMTPNIMNSVVLN